MFESLEKFESRDLKYRFLEDVDKSFFVSLYSNPEVMRYICRPFSQEEAEELFEDKISERAKDEKKRYIWFVENAIEPLGFVGLTKVDSLWEIGAVLSLPSIGKGYGTKIMSDLLTNVFDHYPLQKVLGTIPARNIPCQKSVLKLGFEYAGNTKDQHNQIWYLERAKFKKMISVNNAIKL
ncbi:GNAT family N-acetyltransferase [Kangiella aquimarina]|uniref:GNAT family N-acetyltransferase n=1 Tax=Kangiella aquimarina TaxID=261965 RepID=A0ABZ0X420_9GAMM|nr:GNAT family N-acetyltransferase [Kangiella aquimarina]WQG85328.1 GNAT family N-acetyltransferase [Kangiella aquimarina]